MNLVKVDIVGLKATERVFDGSREPASRAATLVGIVAHRRESLGGEHDVVSSAFQRLADDLFGFALAVPVGGVDEVDAEVERPVNDPGALVVIGIGQLSEHHRAKAVGADHYPGPAERAVTHACLLHSAKKNPVCWQIDLNGI